jgi:histidinol-phosphatase
MSDWDRELAFAHELADRAAEIGREVFHREFEVRRKEDDTPVTEADTRIEAMLRERISDRFPHDAILGEEEGAQGSGDRQWIVDPIDGTKNFAARIPVWATLIALSVEGQTKLGMASAPTIDERYWATRGGGAQMNGRTIHVSETNDIGKASLAVAGVETWVERPDREAFVQVCQDADRVGGFGDFWGHCLVARGAADAMMDPYLRTWDFAALEVIVEEAGGKISQADGAPLADTMSTLSANPSMHAEITRRFA